MIHFLYPVSQITFKYDESGFACKIGHTTIGPGPANRVCGCGRKGCLETANILFGGLALTRDLIFEPTNAFREENLLIIYKGKVKLLQSELSTQNAVVPGASSLVWSVNVQ